MDGEKSVVQDEKVLKAKSGYAMLLLGIIGMLLGVAVIIAGCMVFGQTIVVQLSRQKSKLFIMN